MSERVKLEALATIVVTVVQLSTTRISWKMLNMNKNSIRWSIRKLGRAGSNNWAMKLILKMLLHLVNRLQGRLKDRDKSREKGSVTHRRENRIIMRKTVNPPRISVMELVQRITMWGRVSSWSRRSWCNHLQPVRTVIMLKMILMKMVQH